MPTKSFVESNSSTPTKPSYDAKMFESATVDEIILDNVKNVPGPDRAELLMMLREKIITVEEFKDLDKTMLDNARINMSSANAEMFKGLNSKTVKGSNIHNGHHK
ncbi:hypothetical protein BDQ17DRAFT_1404586 [Cyathus striatus]|nr:hypothetical protein BDQ17DRAFT_1417798 [Cyathus striatus]KAF9014263.1 hypothetical protein BDQ17DRAFT_1404586 [Cyathus striatus]